MQAIKETNHPVTYIKSVEEISDRFDGYIIDLWGVLHDGENAFEGAVKALLQLKKHQKKVCLLSNAPHSKAYILQKMAGMGFHMGEHFDDIVTSGEVSRQYLKSNSNLGKKLYHIGDAVEKDVFEKLGFQEVTDPHDADFVLNTGRERQDTDVEVYRSRLEVCLQSNLQMICANPDLIVFNGRENRLVICAGEIARIYEEMDGKVTYFGKPHSDVYQYCYDVLDCAKDRILMVGDAMVTDVAGANNQGISSLLVASGIHEKELMTADGEMLETTHLGGFFEKWQRKIDYLIKDFSW